MRRQPVPRGKVERDVHAAPRRRRRLHLGLSLALVVGHWPFEGPSLFGAGTHGIHAGDLAVVVATTIASMVVLRSDRRPVVHPPFACC